jgi:hypothetical protein
MANDELFDFSDGDKPWHRLRAKTADGRVVYESGKAWSAFKVYAGMGDERTLRSVAEQVGKSRQLMERWSKRWNWVERVKAYDEMLQQHDQAAMLKERKAMAIRQGRVAVLGQNVATLAIVQIQERLQGRGGKLLTAHEAVRLFEACSRIERICRGDPPDGSEVAAINVHLDLQKRPRYAEAAPETEIVAESSALLEMLNPTDPEDLDS